MKDGLTGLLLRGQYEEDLKTFKQNDLCVVYFDINNLKKTNDTLGHRFGDKLIVTATDALKANFRNENIYRTGGDEFIILVNGVGPKVIEDRLKRINDTLKAATEADPDGLIYQIASGYCIGDGILTKQEIEEKAESMMYQNKKILKGEDKKSNQSLLDQARKNLTVREEPVKPTPKREIKTEEFKPIPIVEKFKNEISIEPFISSGVIVMMFIIFYFFLMRM